MADPRTMAAVAAAFIEPRCLVPKNSAQKAFGSVEFAPDVIPRKTKPKSAVNNVFPNANNKKAIIIGSWK